MNNKNKALLGRPMAVGGPKRPLSSRIGSAGSERGNNQVVQPPARHRLYNNQYRNLAIANLIP